MPKKEQMRKKTAKEEKLFENLLKITYEFVKGKHYTPLSQESLLERLKIHKDHISIFDGVLKQLKEEGKLKIAEQKYLPQDPTVAGITIGTIKVHPRGFGFVEPKNLGQDDIFIPKPHINGAIDGDVVEVVIQSTSEKGPEGKVISVIERKRKTLVAIITHLYETKAMCYSSLLGESNTIQMVLPEEHTLQIGDRILVEVLQWGDKNQITTAIFSRLIGPISDASKDVDVAILEFEIRQAFSNNVLKEAASFGTKVSKQDLKDREDLRSLECFTIDPDTAKDFDDAVSLTEESGLHILGVHIADVSHYVKSGSFLDNEAILRCNSTYFPRKCIPMLPHELSDNLCSLKEGVIRLTVSVFMYFNASGELQNYRIVRSYIKSAKRFTYKQAKAVLDGKLKSKHSSTMKKMVDLCALLKKKRKERGSVELYMPELFIHIDDEGKPSGTETIEYDITHQMVEEFMLRANEVVATHLAKEGKHLTYRIHEEPSKESLREFAALAQAFGYQMPQDPTPHDIQNFFLEAEGSSFAQYLATCYIKSMKLACYSADNIGHYGLSLEHYCHFTSPIRRYVDIISHRLLFAAEPIDKLSLDALCTLASEKERISAKAENSVMNLKKLRLLSQMTEQNKGHQFECVVTRVKPFGIYFDAMELMLEGFLHVSELENDYFMFDETRMRLIGSYHGITYRAGDVIYVMVKKINMILQEAGWQIIGSKAQEKARDSTDRRPFKKSGSKYRRRKK